MHLVNQQCEEKKPNNLKSPGKPNNLPKQVINNEACGKQDTMLENEDQRAPWSNVYLNNISIVSKVNLVSVVRG